MKFAKVIFLVVVLGIIGSLLYWMFSGAPTEGAFPSISSITSMNKKNPNEAVEHQSVGSYVVVDGKVIFELPNYITGGVVENGVKDIFGAYSFEIPSGKTIKDNTQLAISYLYLEGAKDQSKILKITEIFFDGTLVWRDSPNQQFKIKVKPSDVSVGTVKRSL